MLASVDGVSPNCVSGRSGGACVDDWQTRHVYVIEASARNGSPLAPEVAIPKRILYIDSEGWFVIASDQYGLDGNLRKTVVVHAYRDRPTINANARWPFKRMFETALIDEDLTNGFSTAVYTQPDYDGDSLYIDTGAIDRDFFTPARMVQAGH